MQDGHLFIERRSLEKQPLGRFGLRFGVGSEDSASLQGLFDVELIQRLVILRGDRLQRPPVQVAQQRKPCDPIALLEMKIVGFDDVEQNSLVIVSAGR